MDSTPLIDIRINSPEKVIWEGQGLSVSSINDSGPFDILPMHTNFITFVDNNKILVRTQNQILEFKFDRAIIYNYINKIVIFANV